MNHPTTSDVASIRSREERWNAISHATGFLLAGAALPILVVRAEDGGGFAILGALVFGATMMLTLGASTIYHWSRSPRWRRRWRILDHASIYLLIAGSYTPLCLTSLRGPWGWSLLITVWTMAAAGVLLKLRFTGRFDRLSTAMYLVMGWSCLVAAVPMVQLLSPATLIALVCAGAAFTVGVAFYLKDHRGGFHFAWHLFVLAGCAGLYSAMFLELPSG